MSVFRELLSVAKIDPNLVNSITLQSRECNVMGLGDTVLYGL
jgi:hypothetical protein